MVYTKDDVAGLPIQPWTSLQDFFDNHPPSLELKRSHVVLSITALQALVADPQTPSLLDPVARHKQLLQGYFGEMIAGPAIFTDAYETTRIFEGTTRSYIIIPPERVKALPDVQDPADFLVADDGNS